MGDNISFSAAPDMAAPPARGTLLRPLISEWTAGQPPRKVTLAEAAPSAGVRWIDVDLGAAEIRDPALRERAAAALHGQIEGLCGGELRQQMIVDLLSCIHPRQHRRYDDGRVRLAVPFEVASEEIDGADPDHGGMVTVRLLVFQPVACLAGDDWIITCWHRRRRYGGAMPFGEDADPKPHDNIFGIVARRWRESEARTAGDLCVLVLDELALSYAPAHRKLYGWLEAWELALYLDADISGVRRAPDRATLPDLWGSMAVLRDWLNPLNRPGIRGDIDKAWFFGCTNHQAVIGVDERVDRALDGLRDLGTTLRSSFGLLHVQLAEAQHERTERLQRMIEYVTAAILIPALIVGFYGVNTRLPGQATWWGFWVMVSAMLTLGGGSLLALRLAHRRDAARLQAAGDFRAHARAGLIRDAAHEAN